MRAVWSFGACCLHQRFSNVAWLFIGLFALVGCSPVFNWREVRPADTTLLTVFPCKPEQTVRSVTMGGKDVVMKMLSCETVDTNFSLTYSDMKDSKGLNTTLMHWRQSTLSNMRALPTVDAAYSLKGAKEVASAVMVTAPGTRVDGSAMSIEGVWFTFGTQVFQAIVTASSMNAEVADTFFSGIRTQ